MKETGTYSAQNRVENHSVSISFLFPDLFQILTVTLRQRPSTSQGKGGGEAPLRAFLFEYQEPDALAARVQSSGSAMEFLGRRHTCCVEEQVRALIDNSLFDVANCH